MKDKYNEEKEKFQKIVKQYGLTTSVTRSLKRNEKPVNKPHQNKLFITSFVFKWDEEEVVEAVVVQDK